MRLQRIVDMLEGGYAMVIGAYTLVDFDLDEMPPGLIDHREWTDENGHNNALRVNGLGAPRAFSTALMRETGFLNVSYGEDYAAALRVCREYRIGRIYESLYLCRRWPGNTDAGPRLGQREPEQRIQGRGQDGRDRGQAGDEQVGRRQAMSESGVILTDRISGVFDGKGASEAAWPGFASTSSKKQKEDLARVPGRLCVARAGEGAGSPLHGVLRPRPAQSGQDREHPRGRAR